MTHPAHSSRSTLAAVFASRRMAAMLGLGFSSGLPLALSAGTLQAWLTVEGIDIKTIGLFALVGLPYTFKFVWAPLLDRFEPSWLGRRRAWLLVTQLLLSGICLAMSTLDPVASIGLLGGLAVAMAFLSASQDIVFDAYRADLLGPHERGAGAAVSVLGYRLAMLVSGGLALILADQWLGWSGAYQVMAVLFVLMAILTLLVPRLAAQAPLARDARDTASAEWKGFVAMLLAGGLTAWVLHGLGAAVLPEGASRFLRLGVDTAMILGACAAGLGAARWAGFPSFVQPWDAFFSRRHALALLAMIVLYKLGDAFAGSLSTAFLIRGAGFSATEVGAVNKALGLIATIVGALAGGALLTRVRLYPALMIFGVLQAVSNLGYWLIAVSPKSHGLMAAAIGIENLCGGLGTAAFVAFLMGLTDARFSAAQYALLSALAAVGRVYVGPSAGVMVEAFGWPTFFLLTVLAALPGLLVLRLLRQDVNEIDARQREDARSSERASGA
ncbi:MAG: AmpG family muropeptide MFS transporter [Burkholderiaceae bacterium]